MKEQNLTLKQKIIQLLAEADAPMRCGDIARSVQATSRMVASTLRHTIKDGSWPNLRRVGVSPHFRYTANDKIKIPAGVKKRPMRAQHPIMADLWRGWGSAPVLGQGKSNLVEEWGHDT